jgi:tRNA A-37 threonylcarbamoyl transferase component Bud32
LILEFLPQLAELHNSGALHGDLNMRNLYLNKNGKIGMIDLDGMRLTGKPLKAALRAKELARLASGFLLCCREWNETENFTEEILQSYSKYAAVTPTLEETLPLTQKFINRARKHYEY